MTECNWGMGITQKFLVLCKSHWWSRRQVQTPRLPRVLAPRLRKLRIILVDHLEQLARLCVCVCLSDRAINFELNYFWQDGWHAVSSWCCLYVRRSTSLTQVYLHCNFRKRTVSSYFSFFSPAAKSDLELDLWRTWPIDRDKMNRYEKLKSSFVSRNIVRTNRHTYASDRSLYLGH